MDTFSLLSGQLDHLRQLIKIRLDEYEDSEFTAEVNELSQGVNWALPKFLKPDWLDALFSENTNEDEYLLRAALYIGIADQSLKRSDFSSALSKMMQVQSSLGSIDALACHRRQNALKANKENIEMKKQAIKYWTENIDVNLSNDKAAAILAKQVPLSTRVLSRYISEAKKEIKMRAEIHERLKSELIPIGIIGSNGALRYWDGKNTTS